jgi:ELWxxDGT repeat protein
VPGPRLFFTANDGVALGLWKTDGTDAGTVRVNAVPFSDMTVFNGKLYFAASDNALDVELWKTDGTDAGTVRVKDINPGVDGSWPSQLTVFNGALYFTANDGVAGAELWKTDGTDAGTVRVKDINPGAVDSFPDCLRSSMGRCISGLPTVFRDNFGRPTAPMPEQCA